MQVQHVMSRVVELMNPDHSVTEAADRMAKKDFGLLPVGENDRLVGVVSDRDITCRAVAAHKNTDEMKIREIMTEDVQFCFEEDDLETAGKRMKDKKVRRLMVLNSDKRLTGMMSLGDIAHSGMADEQVKKLLESVSEPIDSARE